MHDHLIKLDGMLTLRISADAPVPLAEICPTIIRRLGALRLGLLHSLMRSGLRVRDTLRFTCQ